VVVEVAQSIGQGAGRCLRVVVEHGLSLTDGSRGKGEG
jgi:hypothetical protein